MLGADRLNALLVRCGAATEEEIMAGVWSGGQCPYTIRRTATGGRQIDIDKHDALFRASGATLEAAVAVLEAKVGA